ncbi:MAG: IPTL-CTERM sorting domain-containing protein [Nitrosomonadales bacterium]|nr:IPTL-CTERM sorting domain-containing protein [Nitrosomonadales bacterium]
MNIIGSTAYFAWLKLLGFVWEVQPKLLADVVIHMQKTGSKASSSSQCLPALRVLRIAVAIVCTIWADAALSAQPPAEALRMLNAGQPVELIVEYEAAAIEQAAAAMRQRNPKHIDDAAILAYKAGRYKTIKNNADLAAAHKDIEPLSDYSHLPMSFKRFRSLQGLNLLLARPEIKAVYWNDALHPVLAQSLPLIGQPAVVGAGEIGTGSTVAVIDNGIDFTNAAFGSCTAPGVPASCHVAVSLNFGTGTTNNSHGTNVSAVVLGVAPGSQIAMLNAFSGTTAYTADIINAMNWAIANKPAYNIVAINMSLGDGTRNTTLCTANNPFATPVGNANNAGISVAAAAGNDAYTNALGKPACTPGVVSVGAVYDSDLSTQGYPAGIIWGTLCTDVTTAADKITCFSDSASFLTMLAPGAMITAAGITDGGTSQASPHVAGAVAMLSAAFPLESLTQIQTRLTASGTMITDPRNGIVKPRLNLLEAARPANDAFANRNALAGASVSGTNLLATKETGEPNHAGNTGGHSVWWKLTPASAGQLSLNTQGSGFSTLLAVYTGTSVSTLTPIATSANGAVLLQTQPNQEYEIAIDGANGASGAITLNWNLNTTAAADMSATISGPTTAWVGSSSNYTVTVINAGPQSATNAKATITLPAGSSYVPGSAACTAATNTVTCIAGTLASGTSMSFPIQLAWNTSLAAATISATAASDQPDPTITNNTTALQVTVIVMNDNNDIPTLPQWGMIILSMLLGMIAIRTQRRKIVRSAH